MWVLGWELELFVDDVVGVRCRYWCGVVVVVGCVVIVDCVVCVVVICLLFGNCCLGNDCFVIG